MARDHKVVGVSHAAHDCGRIGAGSLQTLAVLLRRLEGFEGKSRCTLVCATNRPQDVDPALLSRFGAIIHFPQPDASARQKIWAMYVYVPRRPAAAAVHHRSRRHASNGCAPGGVYMVYNLEWHAGEFA